MASATAKLPAAAKLPASAKLLAAATLPAATNTLTTAIARNIVAPVNQELQQWQSCTEGGGASSTIGGTVMEGNKYACRYKEATAVFQKNLENFN
jgi:hypothetical protein